jgi:hypothetical protein
MIKIEEKKVKVLFAKGENGAIAIGVKGNKITFEPIIDYVEVGKKATEEIIGEKQVTLEFGNTASIDILIRALQYTKANIERAQNTIPFAC